MTIPEAQLDVWAKQGPTGQFTDTYNAIKKVLESSNAPYTVANCSVHLQGSYSNDTNVYGDSDVDIVICNSSQFNYDLDHLPPEQATAFRAAHSNVPSIANSFKQQVIGWLGSYYGKANVTRGNKAIYLRGSGTRRVADILACIEHRQYSRYDGINPPNFEPGVQFFDSKGNAIVNFPRQHAAACTAKHQATRTWFKPTVRIFKNMRNRLLNDNKLAEGIAPSYYIEGMLWNIPDVLYGASYSDTFVTAIKWLQACDKDNLLCANRKRWLLRDGKPDSWPPANCDTFIAALVTQWNNWK
ncbi:MAG: nucleotidyltransferase [Burkholderiaceae bacterium]|nr:nucleotidyltransferase [Burkholderiaceae bacterium]